ncbi:MAG: TlyA family RNA methyltransferase [Proteobacteria bacterium]|nr:TlyA family RNA methyltransferase [Desulfobulbaceae bacterium]MBU4153953.1 TlyA family RNA methyltransferase [Pseudomonadota bacterium]
MKHRLDSLLVNAGLAPTTEKALALILAGQVTVAGHRADKPGLLLNEGTEITLKESACPFVSRGGMKLDKALDTFQIDPNGLICADIGASTGGFTDCLLQHGATKVYAIDVGYGQLAWSLRQDSRVIVMERTNARHLTPAMFPDPINLAVIDAAFISLKLLLPPLLPLFKQHPIAILALIKPQFEVDRGATVSGVVSEPALHQQVIDNILTFCHGLGLTDHGVTDSPILGPKGNKEFLVYLTGTGPLSIELSP